VKKHPWFVSDVMKSDLDWTLDYLKDLKPDEDEEIDSQKLEKVVSFQQKVRDLLAEGKLEVLADDFWTYPHDFA
jgi:hypothetical protein